MCHVPHAPQVCVCVGGCVCVCCVCVVTETVHMCIRSFGTMTSMQTLRMPRIYDVTHATAHHHGISIQSDLLPQAQEGQDSTRPWPDCTPARTYSHNISAPQDLHQLRSAGAYVCVCAHVCACVPHTRSSLETTRGAFMAPASHARTHTHIAGLKYLVSISG